MIRNVSNGQMTFIIQNSNKNIVFSNSLQTELAFFTLDDIGLFVGKATICVSSKISEQTPFK